MLYLACWLWLYVLSYLWRQIVFYALPWDSIFRKQSFIIQYQHDILWPVVEATKFLVTLASWEHDKKPLKEIKQILRNAKMISKIMITGQVLVPEPVPVKNSICIVTFRLNNNHVWVPLKRKVNSFLHRASLASDHIIEQMCHPFFIVVWFFSTKNKIVSKSPAPGTCLFSIKSWTWPWWSSVSLNISWARCCCCCSDLLPLEKFSKEEV